jgi:hypothetical protein
MWKIAVSPKEEHVLVLTSKQQLYSVSDMAKDQTAESRVNLFILLFFFNRIIFLYRILFNWNLFFIHIINLEYVV